MSRYTFIVGVAAVALAAAPAFAQGTPVPTSKSPAATPAKGTVPMDVQNPPAHSTHMAGPTHKMHGMMSSKTSAVHPDMSADQLNAKELASIQGSTSAPAPMPMKKTP